MAVYCINSRVLVDIIILQFHYGNIYKYEQNYITLKHYKPLLEMATNNEGRKIFLPLILVFHRNGAVIVLLLFTKQQLR